MSVDAIECGRARGVRNVLAQHYSAGYPDGRRRAGTAGAGASVARSSAVFLSGKATGGDIAWVDVLCSDNFFCGTTGANCNVCERHTNALDPTGHQPMGRLSGSSSLCWPTADHSPNGDQRPECDSQPSLRDLACRGAHKPLFERKVINVARYDCVVAENNF